MAGAGDDSLRALRFVGPATAEVLAAADVTAEDVERKRVSYRQLTDAGVNPGVAAKIRRYHSLSWSFDADGDLERRSAQIRGLGSAERAWVAASSGEWEGDVDRTGTDASDDAGAADAASDGTADVGDWTPGGWPGQDDAHADGSGDPVAAETAWRDRSEPTPVVELDGVDEATAATLADGGIRSVRSLATADPEQVAAVLDLPEASVRAWWEAARESL
ncbi:MAG: helix-hairpin-helix domain-containing protein [Haloferacaceae archaeon]